MCQIRFFGADNWSQLFMHIVYVKRQAPSWNTELNIEEEERAKKKKKTHIKPKIVAVMRNENELSSFE